MNSVDAISIAAYKTLIAGIQAIDGLESATLIGKPVSKRTYERVNDIDVVAIFDAMTPARYGALERAMDNAREYTTPTVDILSAVANGPMKPTSERHSETFLHIIALTPETYRAISPSCSLYSWQSIPPILGKPLSYYDCMPPLTLRAARTSGSGIESVMRTTAALTGRAEMWLRENGHMVCKLIRFSPAEPEGQLELPLYSTLRAASNTLKALLRDDSIAVDERMGTLFASVYQTGRFAFEPLRAHALKRKLRNRTVRVTESLVREEQERSLEFLHALHADVQRREQQEPILP